MASPGLPPGRGACPKWGRAGRARSMPTGRAIFSGVTGCAILRPCVRPCACRHRRLWTLVSKPRGPGMRARDGCVHKVSSSQARKSIIAPALGQAYEGCDEPSRSNDENRGSEPVPGFRQVLPIPGRRACPPSQALSLLPRARLGVGSGGDDRRPPDDHARIQQLPGLSQRPAGEGGRRRRGPEVWIELRDRKSTRLNSSHSQISYAVFCLKKKKKKPTCKSG